MDCLPLLRISARLLDLHDAERAPGNSSAFSQEERRGRHDGLYLDLAAAVLEVLRGYAHKSGNAFMAFDALLIDVKAITPNVQPEDLRYVLNVMSRPTELWAMSREQDIPKLVSDKASELVEKTFFAEDYRLAPAGRAAIAVAANIQSFAYAEGDVLKLLRAIESGDFTRVPTFCSAILDSIRYESVDLRQVIERGFVDRQSAIYKNQLPRYRQVITQSSDLLRQADARLKAWRSPGNDALDEAIEVDLYDLEQHLLQVYRALEAFGRELAELTALAAQRRVSVVAAPDFLKAALQMVKTPASAAQISYVVRQFGPVVLDVSYPSAVDAIGKVRIEVPRSVQSGSFSTDGAETIGRDNRLEFLAEFGPVIRNRLLQNPLPLSEALDNGWCRVDGGPALIELMGVYVAPWVLGEDLRIEIRVPADMVAHPGIGMGEIFLSNLELAIHDAEASP